MSIPIDQHEVAVNGESRVVPHGSTLPDLLRCVHIDPMQAKGIAVAVNEEIVRRAAWPEVVIRAGDRIEIVTANPGG